MGYQGSSNSSEGLTLLDINHRVISVTVAYPGRRSSEQIDSIFKEIDSCLKGGTYIPNAVPRAGGGAYPADFIEGSEEEGPEVTTNSFGADFAASSIMSSLTIKALMNRLEKSRVPSACTPTFLGEHCRANNPLEGYFAFSYLVMRAGARLPLRLYFTDVLEYLGIAPLQLAPNCCAILAALFVIDSQMGFPQPTPLEVNYMCTLKMIPNGGAGFYYLST